MKKLTPKTKLAIIRVTIRRLNRYIIKFTPSRGREMALKRHFGNFKDAQRLVSKIMSAGKINPAHWE